MTSTDIVKLNPNCFSVFAFTRYILSQHILRPGYLSIEASEEVP